VIKLYSCGSFTSFVLHIICELTSVSDCLNSGGSRLWALPSSIQLQKFYKFWLQTQLLHHLNLGLDLPLICTWLCIHPLLFQIKKMRQLGCLNGLMLVLFIKEMELAGFFVILLFWMRLVVAESSGRGPGVAQCGLRHTWDQPLI
jgi:hypothetical protein